MRVNAGSFKYATRPRLFCTVATVAMMVSASAFAQAQDQATETVTVSSTRIANGGFDAPTPTTVISAKEIEKQANPNIFTTITQLPSMMGSTGTAVGTTNSSFGTNGLSSVNIRGIGTQRNLVLIDGERVVPASVTGVDDISQFPQMLIQRVDVVTGGASASWGSDAISGVVNFITEKKFEGFKANINGGMSTYADDPQAQFQFAAGTGFGGGKAHIEVSGEFTSEGGVDSLLGPRKWYKNPFQLQQFSTAQCQPNGCPGGSPMWINGLNGSNAGAAYGGLITRGPLQGTQFGANGVASQLNYGFGYNGQPATPLLLAGSASVANCAPSGNCLGGDTGGNQTGYQSMVARLVRGNTFARISYDITPDIEIYGTGMYSEVVTWNKPTQTFFKPDNLSVGCDNAFLPAAVTQACLQNNGQSAAYNARFGYATQSTGNAYAPSAADIANGVAGGAVSNGLVNGFSAGKMTYGTVNSQLKSTENYNNRTLRRFVLGSDGVVNLFGTDWSFKGYVQHGETDLHNTLENSLLNPYYNAAIDAVQVTSANTGSFPGVPVGNIVCRSATARSVGCQPLNIIGTTGATAAARTFIQGLNADGSSAGENGLGPSQVVNQRQDVVDFGFSGEPFSDWAGPISIASGFQYREEAFKTTTDCASQGNCANQVFDGVQYGPAGDPLLNSSSGVDASGRPLPPLSPNWYAGNFQPGRGVFHEYEIFEETNVPLLNDADWGKVNLNVAGRYTHYSTSGDIETWKVGGTWDTPVDGVRLRALQSRDVRAPSLQDLFAGSRIGNGSVLDDFPLNGVPNQTINPLPTPIQSNPNLKPEKGQTTELGAVWSPSMVPGLNLSATYYRVAVKGVIAQLNNQQEMDLCFNGNATYCSFLSTNGVPWAANGVINSALTLTRPNSQIEPSINIASVVTDGIDYEASYHFATDDVVNWGLGGDVSLRLLATNVMKYRVDPGIIGGVVSEYAGNNANSTYGTPHWKIFFNESYDADNWGLFVNERGFSAGQIDRNWVACASACPAPVDSNHPTVSSNYMPGKLYFDIGGNYDVTPHTSLYFKVDNVTNENPGDANPYTSGFQLAPINPALYDDLGRFYHVGVRILD
jgi:iron complex outermembrane receptor protein